MTKAWSGCVVEVQGRCSVRIITLLSTALKIPLQDKNLINKIENTMEERR